MSDLRAKLMALRCGAVQAVPVETGGALQTFYVRVLSGEERDSYEAENSKYEMQGRGRRATMRAEIVLTNRRARLLARTLADADGKRLFHDGEADLLGSAVDGRVLDTLYEAACRLNRVDLGALEGEEKNPSTTTPACSSGSGSPAT